MSLEILLENYLKEVGWVGSEIDEHLDKIINTEENVALQIDLLRNRILRFELALSMSSFIVACAALVTGLFGMNLLSHLEHHPAVFWAVAGTLGAGMMVSWHQLRRYGKRERLF
jgi:magnesium transporter